jgi:hypothetical protein
MYPATDIDPFRAPRIRQIKAQFAGNGRSPCQELQRGAGESAGLPSGEPLWGHLRRCAFLKWGPPFLRTRALTPQRPAEWVNICGGVH